MRYAAKVDANQSLIVETLRLAGYTVCSMHAVGGGFPDLIVSKRGTNNMWLLEVKTAKGRLTKREREWIDAWGAPVHIVRSPEEALEAVGAAVYVTGSSVYVTGRK